MCLFRLKLKINHIISLISKGKEEEREYTKIYDLFFFLIDLSKLDLKKLFCWRLILNMMNRFNFNLVNRNKYQWEKYSYNRMRSKNAIIYIFLSSNKFNPSSEMYLVFIAFIFYWFTLFEWKITFFNYMKILMVKS